MRLLRDLSGLSQVGFSLPGGVYVCNEDCTRKEYVDFQGNSYTQQPIYGKQPWIDVILCPVY